MAGVILRKLWKSRSYQKLTTPPDEKFCGWSETKLMKSEKKTKTQNLDPLWAPHAFPSIAASLLLSPHKAQWTGLVRLAVTHSVTRSLLSQSSLFPLIFFSQGRRKGPLFLVLSPSFSFLRKELLRKINTCTLSFVKLSSVASRWYFFFTLSLSLFFPPLLY